MAMSVGPSSGESGVMVEMNTTPLIDVMLVLLIMLIMSIPPQSHAVKLDMPRPNNDPPQTEPVIVDLLIDFDNTVYWNGTPVDLARLSGFFRDAATKDIQPEIHLRPNRLAKYDTVATVLATAQRLGVKKLGVTSSDQFL